LATLAMAIVCAVGCRRPTQSVRSSDLEIWDRSEMEYRTNEIHAAYQTLLKLRDQLHAMKSAGRKVLYYPTCDKIVSGRLYVVGEQLGDTNAAFYYRECVRYFSDDDQKYHHPPMEYTPAVIRDLIKTYDANTYDGTGTVLWREKVTK
jgi:hypothetical protein